MHVYVPFCNSVLTYLGVMGTLIYKCLSWDSNQQQELGKPSQKKIASLL